MASPRKHVPYEFSLKEAKRKCSEKNSCFVMEKTTEHIVLHPRYLGCVKKGVHEHMKCKLMRHSDILNGVPVNYEGFEIEQRAGSILEESPYIHFDVKVNVILFKPTIGSTLVGTVNKLGIDHVGCLVHNCFNASIAKSNFTNGLLFDSLDIGSEFTFKVIGTEAVNGVLAIIGEVKEPKDNKRKRKHKDIETVEKQSNDEGDQPREVTKLYPKRLNQNGLNIPDGNIKVKKREKVDKHSREKDRMEIY